MFLLKQSGENSMVEATFIRINKRTKKLSGDTKATFTKTFKTLEDYALFRYKCKNAVSIIDNLTYEQELACRGKLVSMFGKVY